MADLYTLLQDVSLLSDDGLAYYHKVVSRLITSNNTSIKQEIINQVNTDISNTINSDVNAKIENLRTELTNASEEELQALKAELIASLQPKIVGSEGQTITFDKDGNVIAVDKVGGGGGAFSVYYQNFAETDWNSNGDIHIPFSKHGLTPSSNEVCFTIYGVTGHNVKDYESETDLAEFKADIIAMYKAAIEANNAAAGTYPTDANGYITFTWNQIQLYILEDTLMTASAAAAKVAEYHINWENMKTVNVEPTETLANYMNSAYMPALNGPAVQFNNLSTIQNINGWRFRHAILKNGAMDVGAAGKYDLIGARTLTWGAATSVVHFDPTTKDLVIHCNMAEFNYEGFVVVMSDNADS